MIDIFLVESPATSVALSPSGDFLASTHVDDLGIYLWSNKTMYSHVSLRPLSSKATPTLTQLPTTRMTQLDEVNNDITEEAKSETNSLVESMEDISEKCTPLADGLVTLSSLPKSRWSNLLNLDVIKQRNKPVEPPKAPKLAPFFLPTLPGLQPKFLPAEDDSEIPDTEAGGGSKILNLGELKPLTEFQKCLQQCSRSKHCEFLFYLFYLFQHICLLCAQSIYGFFLYLDTPLMELIKELPPAAIDAEFHSLAPESGGSLEWLAQLLRFLLEMLKTYQDFELVQSYIGLFLKVSTLHGGGGGGVAQGRLQDTFMHG